jgi:hypothetical protein
MGSVTPVKPLGVLAMIDDGELDWKVGFFFLEVLIFFVDKKISSLFLPRFRLVFRSRETANSDDSTTTDHLHQLGRPASRRGQRRRGRRAVRRKSFPFSPFFLSFSIPSLSLFSLSPLSALVFASETHSNTLYCAASSRASSNASVCGSATTRSRTASPRTSSGELFFSVASPPPLSLSRPPALPRLFGSLSLAPPVSPSPLRFFLSLFFP